MGLVALLDNGEIRTSMSRHVRIAMTLRTGQVPSKCIGAVIVNGRMWFNRSSLKIQYKAE